MRAYLILLASLACSQIEAQPAKEPPKPVELIGTATDYFYKREWRSYYWREDFSFLLKDEKSGDTWRIISREPTPNYEFRMGTTYPGLKVEWAAKPRVKVVGVTGVDRLPVEFYDFKLNEPRIATALVVWVETGKDTWREFYVNNWFHKWGDKADRAIHKLYAGKKAPYDIYGYIHGQAAPFSKKSQALIAQHAKARTFHGLIRVADNAYGYEIELLHLVGPDAGGNGVIFFGDPQAIPRLDNKK